MKVQVLVGKKEGKVINCVNLLNIQNYLEHFRY